MIPVEYVRGKDQYRDLISNSIKNTRDNIFYPCLDTPDNVDEFISMDDLIKVKVAVYLLEDGRVHLQEMYIDGDFAYNIENGFTEVVK